MGLMQARPPAPEGRQNSRTTAALLDHCQDLPMPRSRNISLLAALGILVIALVVRAQITPKPAAPITPAQQAKDAQLDKQFSSQVLPILNQYCFGCHGNGKKKGDLILDRFTTLQTVRADKKVWASVTDMLEQHSMPPDNKPQPT